MPTQRQLRVADRLKAEIARILRVEVEDPLIGFVTVTDVEVSADLKHARIFFSVLGDSPDAPEEALKGLRRSRKFVQRCLAEQAELRYTPSLEFRYDSTAARAQQLEMLLHQAAAERAATGDESAGEPDADAPEDADSTDDASHHTESD